MTGIGVGEGRGEGHVGFHRPPISAASCQWFDVTWRDAIVLHTSVSCLLPHSWREACDAHIDAVPAAAQVASSPPN